MFKFGKKKGDAAADAALPAVQDGAAGADGDAAAAKKKKLPLLFIIAPVALLVLGGGGAAAFFMMKPKPAEAHGAAAEQGHGAEKAEKKEEKGGGHGGGGKEGEADPSLGVIAAGPDGVTFYTLPDMVMNIQSADSRPTFLKLKLTLEMRDAAVATHLQEEMPRLQDMFTGFVRELRPEDLSGSAGTYQLRAEILRRVNMIAAPGKVDAVLIEEMLVQ
ncbi:flagellar basal body-associated FliL family protein [uncultured Brevundimonas sp.]|uniref:flagellar basal body-associated FliL family protein n=1 Tax=uncultured Brevundimonas sp. TaxID=213418 RepID=UPI0025F6F7C6|nr:flagellar basal body-associated FliL family protein [uncultured Brevundimonas sp.]